MSIAILFALIVGTIFGLIGRCFVPSAARISVWAAILLGLAGAAVGLVVAAVSVPGSSGSTVAVVLIAPIVFAVGAVVLGSAIGRERRAARQSQAGAPNPGPTPAQAPHVKGAEPPPRQPRAPPTRIFLCYRRSDSSHAAGRLASDLRRRYGRDNIFIDVDSIGTGQNYRHGVGEAIQGSAVVLVLIGETWADEHDAHGRRLDNPGDNVRQEVEFALRLGRVLPVLIDGAHMPYPQSLPPSLARLTDLNAAPLRHLSWDDDADRLVRAIDRRRPS